jgi:hypothetical protein
MGTLRDAILEAQDLPTEDVQTDEWGRFGVPFVRVRGLSASEREKWELSVGETDGKKVTHIREKLVVATVIDDDGSPAFQPSDIKMLGERSSAVIVRLFNTARKLSGMRTEAEAEAEANPSKGDQEDDNSSDSPSPSA